MHFEKGQEKNNLKALKIILQRRKQKYEREKSENILWDVERLKKLYDEKSNDQMKK